MCNLLDSASNTKLSFTVQPEEQVTNAITTLLEALFKPGAGWPQAGACLVS